MQKITTFLTYNDQAEAAVAHYTSVFRNAKVLRMNRRGEGGPVISASFELEGQRFMALNGGPSFAFSQGISLLVNCETQAEIDELWEKLSAGGEPGRCGWLTDRFGVSWQIVPSVLGLLLGDQDPGRAGRALQAMLGMGKLDIAALQRAADGA
jgi:predicted 3-demethylubiquinone-9 3-methyltransferase (glyoxalase superfamily)